MYSWLAKNIDKVCHFLMCYGISLSVGYFDWFLGIVLAILCGIGKETFDKLRGGQFDFYDIIADCIGGACGGLFALFAHIVSHT